MWRAARTNLCLSQKYGPFGSALDLTQADQGFVTPHLYFIILLGIQPVELDRVPARKSGPLGPTASSAADDTPA